jgi:hypothetical protein
MRKVPRSKGIKTMKRHRPQQHNNSEAGVALLIAMFVLLLISAVAISMIVASSRESELNGNYRSSSTAYYASVSGLEEARGRLLPRNINYFNNTVAGFIPAGTMTVGQVRYVLNPANGENVLSAYPDNQYAQEFHAAPANIQTIASVSGTNSANVPGPLFKWVRISPVTEASLNIDVNQDNVLDPTTPLFYDTAHLPKPSMIVPSPAGPNPANVPPTAQQVLEVTAFSVLPNGTEKLTQYLVTAQTFGLNFPAPLTLNSSQASMAGGHSANYAINGSDQCGRQFPALPAIGVDGGGSTNISNVIGGLPRPSNYTGAGGTPSVSDVSGSLSSNLQTPATLDALVQLITQNADGVVGTPPPAPPSGSYGPSDLPSAMSSSNPQTVVVNGDYAQSGNFTGNGLLVVTGNFSFSGNTGWNGIILVIGKGTVSGNGGGNNSFNGAIFVANTLDSSGHELATLGPASFSINGGGGSGINYNSCWVNNVQQPPMYKVLSFREIPYTD